MYGTRSRVGNILFPEGQIELFEAIKELHDRIE